MTCYNKVECIGEMFDSILAQDWDNIELILVNDGSTDGTREVIEDYESKFNDRGYTTIIIDQENAGVCAAAKAGLGQVTGKYVCIVDADDELEFNYVSTMARWLNKHPEDDIVSCQGIQYTGRGLEKIFKDPPKNKGTINCAPYVLERWLLGLFPTQAWVYMVRTKYMRKCRIVENYLTDSTGSHEPGYIIPLLAFGGQIKLIKKNLYRFNVGNFSHSTFASLENAQVYYQQYDRLCRRTINALPGRIANKTRKKWLKNVVSVSNTYRTYIHTTRLTKDNTLKENAFLYFLEAINQFFPLQPVIARENINEQEKLIFEVFAQLLFNDRSKKYFVPKNKVRVVGCGAMGKRASRWIPLLKDTCLQPNELWDIEGDGSIVKKPDYSSLTSRDVVLLFPEKTSAPAIQILEDLKDTGCLVFTVADIESYLTCSQQFPELYLGAQRLAKRGIVSIVIPCYNVENCVSNMFDSIIMQAWDDIELIIVNDGSTDKTDLVINEYKPRFLARGFETLVINQENKGLSGAVYAGLKSATGEFVCQVDADDTLEPEYVSTMAGWLSNFPDYEWAACDVYRVDEQGVRVVRSFRFDAESIITAEHFLLRSMAAAWKYMIRSSYMRSCNVLEHYYAGRKGSQEPQLFLPLAVGGGKLKYFNQPLYRYNCFMQEERHSYHAYQSNYTNAASYHNGWFFVVKETIETLPLDEDNKNRLRVIADFSQLKKLLFFTRGQSDLDDETERLIEDYILMINQNFSPSPLIERNQVENLSLLITAAEDNILNVVPKWLAYPYGRIIVWGSQKTPEDNFLLRLKGTPLSPNVAWSTDNYGKLSTKDILIITPDAELNDLLIKAKEDNTCIIFDSTDIVNHWKGCVKKATRHIEKMKRIHAKKLPERAERLAMKVKPISIRNDMINYGRFFYDGTLSFTPEINKEQSNENSIIYPDKTE